MMVIQWQMLVLNVRCDLSLYNIDCDRYLVDCLNMLRNEE